MSPSWAERWQAGLAPDGAEVLRRRLFGRNDGAPQRVPCRPQPGEPGWTAAVDALGQALDAAGARGGSVGLVLSNHFMRYLVLPWQPELNSAADLEALARLRFQAVFGDAASGWTIRCAEGGWQQASLACAVDTELVDALRIVLGQRRLRLASLQPLLMAAFNELRRRLAGDATLAIVEPGRLCLGLLQHGAFDAVVSRRTRDDPARVVEQELATLRPSAEPVALELLRVGEAAAWPDGDARVAREWPARPLATFGVA